MLSLDYCTELWDTIQLDIRDLREFVEVMCNLSHVTTIITTHGLPTEIVECLNHTHELDLLLDGLPVECTMEAIDKTQQTSWETILAKVVPLVKKLETTRKTAITICEQLITEGTAEIDRLKDLQKPIPFVNFTLKIKKGYTLPKLFAELEDMIKSIERFTAKVSQKTTLNDVRSDIQDMKTQYDILTGGETEPVTFSKAGLGSISDILTRIKHVVDIGNRLTTLSKQMQTYQDRVEEVITIARDALSKPDKGKSTFKVDMLRVRTKLTLQETGNHSLIFIIRTYRKIIKSLLATTRTIKASSDSNDTVSSR